MSRLFQAETEGAPFVRGWNTDRSLGLGHAAPTTAGSSSSLDVSLRSAGIMDEPMCGEE
jgi:hypothetical protein